MFEQKKMAEKIPI